MMKVSSKHKKITVSDLDRLAEDYVLRNRPWTKEEDDVVLKHYGKNKVEHIAEALGHSVPSVRNRWQTIKHI